MHVKLVLAGMNCGHCVKALTGELERLPGIGGLIVEVGSASFSVEPFDEGALRLAVDEAGFEISSLDLTAS